MESLSSLVQSFSGKIGNILPGALGAILVLIIGFFLAGVIKRIIIKLFKSTKLDDKINARMQGQINLGKTFGQLGYYLVIIYTLLLVLSMMGVENVLAPLQNMLDEFTGFLPNLLAGGIIAYAGYIIAKLASEAVGIVSTTIESFSHKAGLTSSINLTKIVKQLVFIFVFIPLLIVALDALNMKALSIPASEMLSSFLDAIPKIFSAALIAAIFFIGGKFITAAIKELLKSLGTDNLSQRLKLNTIIGESSLSNSIGNIAFFFIMFAGIISAVEKLEMESISNILAQTLSLSGQIAFGLLILVIGNYVATLIADTLSKSDENKWLATVARFATIGIFLAIGLHTMGIADDIVNLAFGLILGALAVTFALSFGLGGREAAGKHMDHFLKKLRKEN